MLDVAIGQVTTPRCDLEAEVARVSAHGFEALGIWRPKLPDAGAAAAAAILAAARVRASSLRWAGGFTGGDGRSFAESVADAVEAVETAAELGRAAPAAPPPVVVLHSGCRGGHTRSHAHRLLLGALEAILPAARREGVVLAVEPLRAAPGCSFLGSLGEALDVVAACDDPQVGLAIDLWHFGDDPALPILADRLARAAVLVRLADRCGAPTAEADRLPAGHGTLPLERAVAELVRHGYRCVLEFDPAGETVEVLGHEGVLRETRLVADAWAERLAAPAADGSVVRIEPAHSGDGTRPGYLRGPHAAAGSRRSQASSQAVSRG